MPEEDEETRRLQNLRDELAALVRELSAGSRDLARIQARVERLVERLKAALRRNVE